MNLLWTGDNSTFKLSNQLMSVGECKYDMIYHEIFEPANRDPTTDSSFANKK